MRKHARLWKTALAMWYDDGMADEKSARFCRAVGSSVKI
jgi:hypothetical protein